MSIPLPIGFIVLDQNGFLIRNRGSSNSPQIFPTTTLAINAVDDKTKLLSATVYTVLATPVADAPPVSIGRVLGNALATGNVLGHCIIDPADGRPLTAPPHFLNDGLDVWLFGSRTSERDRADRIAARRGLVVHVVTLGVPT
jgi:hypothetical protein